MAQLSSSYVLSTPSVYVDDELWAIVPNSFSDKIPGEMNIQAMSSGGGNIEVVAGLDASKLLGEFAFELANTPLNHERVRTLAAKRERRQPSTVRIVDGGYAKSYMMVYLSNEPQAKWSSDGKLTCEFKGQKAA